jgi:predicted MFS family arabinose efflux permease
VKAYTEAFRHFSRNARLLLVACALQGFAFFGIYALLLNLYLLRLGYGPDFVGQVNAAGPLAMAVASLPAGVFSRRYGSRLGLIVGFFFSSLGLLLLPLNEFLPASVQSVWILGSYAWSWFFAALIVVNLGPFLMGSTSPVERSYAFSVQMATFPFFAFIGSLVGGLLPGLFARVLSSTATQPGPYRLSLLVAGAVAFLEIIVLWRTEDVRVEPAGQAARRAGRSALPLALIFVVALVWMLRIGSEWTMRIFSNVYLDTALATPTALIGALLAAAQLLGLAALGAPAVIARFGKERTIIWATVGMAVAFLPLIFVPHWLAVGVGFMAMMALTSISGPAYGIYSQELVEPEWRTTMSSAMTLTMGGGIAIVASGGSNMLVRYGYPLLFGLGALLAVAAALLFWGYFRKPRGVLVRVPLEPALADAVVE